MLHAEWVRWHSWNSDVADIEDHERQVAETDKNNETHLLSIKSHVV